MYHRSWRRLLAGILAMALPSIALTIDLPDLPSDLGRPQPASASSSAAASTDAHRSATSRSRERDRRPVRPVTNAPAPAPTPSAAEPAPAPPATAAPAPEPTSAAPEAPATSAEPSGLEASTGDYLVTDRTALAALPTSGPAWSAVLEVADADPGAPDLSDQDNKHAGRLVAAALVYARTGQPAYRDKVVSELRALQSAPKLDGARVLSVARQLAGYAIAADLVGYRDPSFVRLLADLRTRELGGHSRWTSISQTSENSASNWGAWALASRIAVSRFVGDSADVRRAAQVFRGFTGDRSAYSGWQKTADFDASWACGGDTWVPINPASCGDRGGALVEDISRSGGTYPSVDETGLTYSWETLGGATLSARLLRHAGYDDVNQWGDRALLRAAQFLARKGGYPPRYGTNQYIPWEIHQAYGVTVGTVGPAGYGRQFGYTDWLTP